MKNFYKIKNNKLQVGYGNIIPDGFNEYKTGEEPKDFIEAQLKEIEYEILQNKINEAKQYLASTDYKMTVDYFATLTKEIQDELILKRNEAREFIRANN